MNSGPRHASGELVRAYASDVDTDPRGSLLAEGHTTRALSANLARLATTRGSVLISGETGTGKTLVARALHQLYAGQNAPQRVINCAALPEAVLVDALYQLDDGAGAEPHGAATVLLDEVGELSPWSQAVLLRKFQAEGAHAPRLLAATHRDLDAMANAGSFSRELLARLSVHRLPLTPLRARRDEIGPLAFHFLRLALRSAGMRFISVDPQLVQTLEAYDWPGNVRELNNAMVRALAANESGTLSHHDLPDPVRVAPVIVAG